MCVCAWGRKGGNESGRRRRAINKAKYMQLSKLSGVSSCLTAVVTMDAFTLSTPRSSLAASTLSEAADHGRTSLRHVSFERLSRWFGIIAEQRL